MELTNREIASLAWLAIFIAWACTIPAFRHGMPVVIKLMFRGPIARVLVLALIYIALWIFALERLNLWEVENSKTTLLWVFTFAILSVLDFNRLMQERLFFRGMLREILSLTVILVFLTDSYTFSLVAELAIIPAVTVLALVQAVPAKNPEEHRANQFVGNLLAVVGLSYLAHGAYKAATDWANFATLATARDFAIPIFLSLLFLPFLFWLKLYATYEQVFCGLRSAIDDPKLRAFARFRSILAFRLNLDLLKRWRRMVNIEQPATREAITASFREVKRLRKIERNPPAISAEEGWSPYAAKRFLEDEGLVTDDYHRSFEEWRCSSAPVKVQEGVLTPTVSYYVIGNERAATELILELNVFNCEDPTAADERFGQLAAILLSRATSRETAQEIAGSLTDDEAADCRLGPLRVRLTKEPYAAMKGVSFERTFMITHELHHQTDVVEGVGE
jgi:hypothetical protein